MQRIMAVIMAHTALILGACVYQPESDDGSIFRSDREAVFKGFASQAGAEVELYGYNRVTNRWDLFASTHASSSPINYGGRMLYHFVIRHRLDTTDTLFIDYFTSPPLGGWVDYRVREPGGPLGTLLTFDPGGLSCTIDRVNHGEDVYLAAWACKAEEYDRVRLYYPFG